MTDPQPQAVRHPPPPPGPPAPPGTLPPPPPGAVPWGFGPPPPRKRRRRGWIVVAIVVGIVLGGLILIGIIGAAVDTSKAVKNASAPARQFDHAEDVQIVRCGPDEYGNVAATVVITNHSSKTSTYSVTVAFDAKAGGAQVGTGYALADQLQPGQASTPQQANSGQNNPAGGYRCRIADATRFAAN